MRKKDPNANKHVQLGMNHGTASNRLRKMIMFKLVCDLGQNSCFQCGEKIFSVEELSVEHKIPWIDSEDPEKLFFDLNNIAFSHLLCNISNHRNKLSEHGTKNRYRKYGCRCDLCKRAIVADMAEYRKRRKFRTGKDR